MLVKCIGRLADKQLLNKQLKGLMLDDLYYHKRTKLLWNRIKSIRQSDNLDTHGHITIGKLEEFFTKKFAAVEEISEINDIHMQKKLEVKHKLDIINKQSRYIHISESVIRKYIKKLNNGSAPRMDGIMSGHLKYAMDSHLVIHLSVLLSLCLIEGSVPDGFCQNVITPVLKGSNLDPTLSNNYRPITVSSSISKLLELYIIDECHNHSFSQCQYGFI